MKAVGYFREAAPGRQGATSLADQSKGFLEFCQDRGYEVIASFVDGAGDEDDRRPGFRQLVDFLRRPEKGFLRLNTRQ